MAINPDPRVAVCIPSQRTWEADMALVFGAMLSHATSKGIRTISINEKSSLVWQARNSMVENALSYDATHIMWIDSDMVPPINLIPRLLMHGKDFVGATYPKRVPPYNLLGIHKDGVDIADGGLQPYILMPGGCNLVSTDVYKAIPKPWYFDTMRRPGTPAESFIALLEDHYQIPLTDGVKEKLFDDHVLFDWLNEENEFNKSKWAGQDTMSEDYNFCRKAARHGFEIFCDLDVTYELGHMAEQKIICQKPELE